MSETFYKWLTPDHCGAYGHGDYSGHLPKGKRAGKWLLKIDRPKLCARGYHVATVSQLAAHITGAPISLFEVEVRGASDIGDDKSAWGEMRLVRRIGSVDRSALILFACDSAERVLPIFEKKYPDDDRPRKAIEAAQSGDSYAAANAAYAAYAANAAAYAADEERLWQGKRLIEIAERSQK